MSTHPIDSANLITQIGNPRVLAESLEAFRKSAGVFSSDRANLIAHYQGQWVAVADQQVVASGKTLNLVLSELEKLGIPAQTTMIRLIDRTTRRLIL